MAYISQIYKKKSNPQTLFTLPSLRVFFSDKARDLQLKNVSRTKETPFSPPSLRVILESKNANFCFLKLYREHL
jgi:hypothetical protein